MTWTMPTPADVDGPTVGPDRPMLHGYLGWQRYTLLNIGAGLTGEQLATRAIAPSGLSLLGLLRHLGKVERIWFLERFAAQDLPPLFPGGKDADFDDVDPAGADEDLARYLDITAQVDAAVAEMDLDRTITWHEQELSLRFVYLHVIHEYARHNGHGDLLREQVDGVTGR